METERIKNLRQLTLLKNLYSDYVSAKLTKIRLQKGDDPKNVYQTIASAGVKRDKDLEGIELNYPAMIRILNAWYNDSRAKVVDFITNSKNLEKIIAKTSVEKIKPGEILGAEYKDGKLNLADTILRAPGRDDNTFGKVAEAHKRFYILSSAFREPNANKEVIENEVKSGIQKTLEEAEVSNQDEWAELFGYIASINPVYATRKIERMLVDAYQCFTKEFGSLSEKSTREYFGEIAKETLTKDNLNGNDKTTIAEGERAMELLHSYT